MLLGVIGAPRKVNVIIDGRTDKVIKSTIIDILIILYILTYIHIIHIHKWRRNEHATNKKSLS